MKQYLTIILIYIMIFACENRSAKFTHMEFCDIHAIPRDREGRPVGDSSFLLRSLFYVIDGSSEKYSSDSVMQVFIKTDPLIQSEIKNKYPTMEITFYHRSSNTDMITNMNSHKFLSDCNNDIIAEYEWKYGKYDGARFYKDGVPVGGENIIIEDMKAERLK